MKQIFACVIALSILAFSTVSIQSQELNEPRRIIFAELQNPDALTFEDPFREMGSEMLEELRTVSRLEQRLEQSDISSEEQALMNRRISEARARLQADGHDADALLEQRWTVAAKRKRATTSTNPELENSEVTISGFLIPAGPDEMGRPTAYLVPEMGMCSHMPPPPPNQLIRVELKEPSSIASPYILVQASGTLRPQTSDETIFILDGSQRMESTWTLEATEVVEATGSMNAGNTNRWLEMVRNRYDNSVQGTYEK